ncbi:MAG: MoxR-like ATPase [Paraglaciecola sp.]|jgi:MoxR-like ATPase
MLFKGTSDYIAPNELQIAVNAAIHLQKPLLVKGEPGTGKTMLAHEIAKALGKPILTWHIKSTTLAQQGLYEYDAVSRLRDSQIGGNDVDNIENYIKKGKLWEAFSQDESVVLLIDEIDKADIEFPNDLLLELDKMEFYVYELQKTIKAVNRPIVIITSNNEKELPDAFLRRCLFHYIRFPEKETMERIVDVHFPKIQEELVSNALKVFYQVRDVRAMKKKPSTSELIDWMKLLLMEKIQGEALDNFKLEENLPPHVHSLIKNEQDLKLLEEMMKMRKKY